MPPAALAVTAVVPVGIAFLPSATVTRIITFAVIGIYVGFQSVVLASVIGRARGWQPAGSFRLGRFGWAVNVAALVYGVTAIVVLSVKTPVNGTSFFDRWMVPLSVGIVAAVGVLHLLVMRPKEHVTEADRAPVSAAVAG